MSILHTARTYRSWLSFAILLSAKSMWHSSFQLVFIHAGDTMQTSQAQLQAPTSVSGDLSDPTMYINRELSWLQFNERVLEEALDVRLPLLERVKFLAIFANNLDEFFMIRVSGLRRQVAGGVMETPPDGMTPSQQLAAIRHVLMLQLFRQVDCWHNDLLPKLREAGIQICRYSALQPKQRMLLQ